LQREFELEDHHVRLLILAGEAWDRCCQARERIEAEGLTIKDRFDQMKPHPAVAIERDSRIAFARMLREVGLDVENTEPPRAPRIGGR
jgi:phage terminase small subunit